MIVYDTYIRMLYNAVIGQFFRELAQRVFMFLAFLLFLFWHQTEEFLVYMYAAAMCTPGLFIFFYPIIKKVHFIRPNFTFLNPEFRKELLPVILFGTVSSGTLLLLTEVDKLMIFRYLGEAPLGIYITLMNYGIFVSIANRALKSIAIPVIAEELKKENLGAVHRIYNSSSINLYLIGAWVFLCVWFNIELILEQFPTTEYLDHKYIVLFLGLGHLIEMLTGLNAEIIATSKYYRYNAYFNGLLVFLLVSFNYLALFVWDIGLEGVAAGTLFSMLIINIIRFIFLKVKFGFHPFTRKTILLTIAVIGIFIIALFLPFTGHMIFDIIWRSLVITALLAVYTLYFSISTEVSAMAAKYLPFYNSKKG